MLEISADASFPGTGADPELGNEDGLNAHSIATMLNDEHLSEMLVKYCRVPQTVSLKPVPSPQLFVRIGLYIFLFITIFYFLHFSVTPVPYVSCYFIDQTLHISICLRISISISSSPFH